MSPILVHFGIASAGALVLVLLAWRLPAKRGDLSVAAMCTAALGCLLASMLTYAEHIIATGACEGESVDLLQKERILTEGFSDGLPRLVIASSILALTTACCLFAFRTRRARFATVAIGAVLLAPMAWLGTRGVGLHDRMVREAFSQVTSASDRCGALAEAVEMAGGMDRAERYEPGARRLAHGCVASWLSAMDRGGDERSVLEGKAQVRQQLRVQEGSTAYDFIESSGLLVDDAQRREVSRRKALAL